MLQPLQPDQLLVEYQQQLLDVNSRIIAGAGVKNTEGLEQLKQLIEIKMLLLVPMLAYDMQKKACDKAPE